MRFKATIAATRKEADGIARRGFLPVGAWVRLPSGSVRFAGFGLGGVPVWVAGRSATVGRVFRAIVRAVRADGRRFAAPAAAAQPTATAAQPAAAVVTAAPAAATDAAPAAVATATAAAVATVRNAAAAGFARFARVARAAGTAAADLAARAIGTALAAAAALPGMDWIAQPIPGSPNAARPAHPGQSQEEQRPCRP